MKIDDLLEEIATDSEIDITQLDSESVKIPKLIGKWTVWFVGESRLLRELDLQYNILVKEKTEYYLGKSADKVYAETPLDNKILRQDLPLYLDADLDLSKINGRRSLQRLKCDTIEAFIKSLNQRSFTISNAIKFIMFKNGING